MSSVALAGVRCAYDSYSTRSVEPRSWLALGITIISVLTVIAEPTELASWGALRSWMLT